MSCPDCGSDAGRDPQTERCRDCGRLPASSDRVDTITGIRSRPASPSRAYRIEKTSVPTSVATAAMRSVTEPLAATVRGLGIDGQTAELGYRCGRCGEPSGMQGHVSGMPPVFTCPPQPAAAYVFGSPTRKVRCECGALIVVLERDELPERCGFCLRPLGAVPSQKE